MKGIKRIAALTMVAVMGVSLLPTADAQVALAKKTVAAKTKKTAKSNGKKVTVKYKKTMTVTDSNVKDLKKILKSDKVKTVKINLNKKKKLTIEKGDYSDKKIIINSPNSSITNYASFDEIEIKAVAPNTFEEKGNLNSIIINAKKNIHLIMASARRAAAVHVKEGSTGENTIDIQKGGLSSLVVDNATKNNIFVRGNSTLGTLSLDSEGVNVNFEASDTSKTNFVEVGENAGSAETNIGINATDKSKIGKIITVAKDASLNIKSQDESSIGSVVVKGDASANISGDSSKKTVVDLSEAKEGAQVKIENKNTEIQTAKGQNIDGIVENKTGEELTTKVKPDPNEKPSGNNGSGAGASGGGSGESAPTYQIETEDGNMIRNGRFPNAGAWINDYKTYVSSGNSYTIANGEARFVINNVGANAWDEMLAQHNLNIENGENYELSFTASSTVNRKISVAVANDDGSEWYGGGDAALTPTEQDFTYRFTADASNADGFLKFSMGTFTMYGSQYEGGSQKFPEDSAASTIVIKNVWLKKVAATNTPGGNEGENNSSEEQNQTPQILLRNGDFASGSDGWTSSLTTGNSSSFENGKAEFVLNTVGANAWDDALAQSGLSLEGGKTYVLKFKASSTADRSISVTVADANGSGWCGGGEPELTSTLTEYTYSFTMASNAQKVLKFSMGRFTTYPDGPVYHDDKSAASTIVIKDVSLMEE